MYAGFAEYFELQISKNFGLSRRSESDFVGSECWNSAQCGSRKMQFHSGRTCHRRIYESRSFRNHPIADEIETHSEVIPT